jgi:hypothetical protein
LACPGQGQHVAIQIVTLELEHICGSWVILNALAMEQLQVFLERLLPLAKNLPQLPFDIAVYPQNKHPLAQLQVLET